MTCIVGYLDKKLGKVVIGADSAGISGFDITIRKNEKVFKNNEFIIGCTSSFRMIQLLRYSFLPPKVHDKDIYEYMCTDFINAVRSCFKDGGYLQKYRDGDEKGGTFLVGYKDRLFTVHDDFQVFETLCGYDSLGCGEGYALGTLFILENENLKAEEKVTKALISAEKFSAGVCRPFHIFNT